jgi:DNA-binding response OmpR family regulator
MSKIAKNIINAIKRSKKSFFTQEEIFKLVLDITKTDESVIESNGVKLDRTSMSIEFNGVKRVLVKLEFELMFYLIENKNKVITRETLMRDVWGGDVHVGCRTIDVCVCKLRKIIGKDKITTLKSVGYRYNE